MQIADALNEIESRIVKDRQAQIEVEADNSTKVPRRTSPVTSKNDTLKNTSYSKIHLNTKVKHILLFLLFYK